MRAGSSGRVWGAAATEGLRPIEKVRSESSGVSSQPDDTTAGRPCTQHHFSTPGPTLFEPTVLLSHLSFLVVAQDLVGLRDLHELLAGCWVVLVRVLFGVGRSAEGDGSSASRAASGEWGKAAVGTLEASSQMT